MVEAASQPFYTGGEYCAAASDAAEPAWKRETGDDLAERFEDLGPRAVMEIENRGLGADQGREAIRALINPHLDQS